MSSGVFTYINDGRFRVFHSEKSDDWDLRISPVAKIDNGTYECQVGNVFVLKCEYLKQTTRKPIGFCRFNKFSSNKHRTEGRPWIVQYIILNTRGNYFHYSWVDVFIHIDTSIVMDLKIIRTIFILSKIFWNNMHHIVVFEYIFHPLNKVHSITTLDKKKKKKNTCLINFTTYQYICLWKMIWVIYHRDNLF